jgi:hypothetical protein
MEVTYRYTLIGRGNRRHCYASESGDEGPVEDLPKERMMKRLERRRSEAAQPVWESGILGREMAPEVHGGVEASDDDQSLVVGTDEEDVATFGGNAAAGEEVSSEPIAQGSGSEGVDPRPELAQVDLLLLGPPSLEGVGADGAEVIEGGLGEDELHCSPRTRSLK